MSSQLSVVSQQFRKRHVSSYRTLCISTFATSALVTACALVWKSAQLQDGATAGNTIQRIETNAYYSGSQMLTGIMLLFSLLTALLLIVSATGFVVEEQRKKYALLYLNGATATQIRIILLRSLGAYGSASSVIGCLAGCALCFPLAALLVSAGGAAPSFTVIVHPSAAIGSLAIMICTLAIGILYASKRITNVSPLETIREVVTEKTGTHTRRMVVAAIPAVGGMAIGFAPTQIQPEARVFCEILLFIIASAIAAPGIFPAIVRGITAAFTFSAPVVVASRRSVRNASRTASIALPVTILMLVVCPFLTLMDTATAESVSTQMSAIPSSIVARGDSAYEPALSTYLQHESTISSSTVFTTQGFAVDDDDTTLYSIAFTDRRSLTANACGMTTLEGDLADLGENKVAAVGNGKHLGDTITIRGIDNTAHTATIVAIVDDIPGLSPSYLALKGSLHSQGKAQPLMAYINATHSRNVVDTWNATHADNTIQLYTKQGFIDYFIEYRNKGRSGTLLLIGGAALLAVLFLVQAADTAAREHLEQDRMLKTICATPQGIVGISALEGVIDVIAAAILSTVVYAVIWCSLIVISSSDMSFRPPISAKAFIVLTLVCLLTTGIVCGARTRKELG